MPPGRRSRLWRSEEGPRAGAVGVRQKSSACHFYGFFCEVMSRPLGTRPWDVRSLLTQSRQDAVRRSHKAFGVREPSPFEEGSRRGAEGAEKEILGGTVRPVFSISSPVFLRALGASARGLESIQTERGGPPRAECPIGGALAGDPVKIPPPSRSKNLLKTT